MYTYRNTKTGATFSTAFACTGGDWEEVKKGKEPKAKEPKNEPPKEGDDDRKEQ